MTNYKDNLEIDLKDLFFYIIKHYKVLLCLTILGCILGSAFGIVKINQSTTVKAESSISLLSAKEIYEVNSAVENYKSYFNRYNEILDYKNNSPLMKIDGYNAPATTCTYMISEYDKSNPIMIESNSITNIHNSIEKNISDNIINLYADELKKSDSIDLIRGSLDKEIKDKYIGELYSINKSGYSMMTVTVYGRTEEESNSISQTLNQIIEQKEELIKETIPHNIVKTSLYTTREKSSYIVANQDSITNQLKDLNNSMISVTSNLNANQKSYFKEQLDASDIDYGTESSEEAKLGITSIIKYGIVGCIAAIFLATVFYSLVYVMSPTIKVADDLKYVFQLPLIGAIQKDKPDTSLIISGISAAAKIHSANKICIISSYSDEIVETYKAEISKSMEDKGIQPIVCQSIINDSESLEKATSAEGIILFETIQKSKYEDISKTIEMCNNYNILILGTILNYE